MEWTREGLGAASFRGLVRFADLSAVEVPRSPGVYVVLRDLADDPAFLEVSPAGRFKRRGPSVPRSTIEAAWVPGARVLHIGEASGGANGRRGVAKRLDEFRRDGAGEPIGHRVGATSGNWSTVTSYSSLGAKPATPTPEEVESGLISEIVNDWRARPFANRKTG